MGKRLNFTTICFYQNYVEIGSASFSSFVFINGTNRGTNFYRVFIMNSALVGRLVFETILEVFRDLGGNGLAKEHYLAVLIAELEKLELAVEKDVPLSFNYKGDALKANLTVDIVVDNQVAVDCVTSAGNSDSKRKVNSFVRSGMCASGYSVNFSRRNIRDGIYSSSIS